MGVSEQTELIRNVRQPSCRLPGLWRKYIRVAEKTVANIREGGYISSIMGRIVSSLRLQNLKEPGATILIDALVDTGSAYLVLPSAWRARLGTLDKIREVTVQLGDQSQRIADVCGPVKIELEGFSPIYGEVLFVEMVPHQGTYEPLLGYIPLEQAQAAVDMVGHRLVPVKTVDLKSAR